MQPDVVLGGLLCMRAFNRAAPILLPVAIAAAVAGCTAAPSTTIGSTTLASTAVPADTQVSSMPAVFAASLVYTPAHTGLSEGERVALYSSQTGRMLRWLTPLQQNVSDSVLNVHDGWVYFLRTGSGSTGPSVWRVAEAGGNAQLVQAGATDYAVSQDGTDVAYVTSADHGRVVEIVARNLASGKRNTIVMATDPCGCSNGFPPNIGELSWAPDDTQLAVTYQLTAAISSVQVFGAFTGKTSRDGRTAPAPCKLNSRAQCTEYGAGYLADGALTYVVEQLSARGTADDSLYAWQGKTLTALLRSFGAALPYLTPREQAIWVQGPTAPKQPWAIWRWTGGAPVRILTLPTLGATAYYGVGGIAW
jgi:hypothetical protein